MDDDEMDAAYWEGMMYGEDDESVVHEKLGYNAFGLYGQGER